MLANIDGALNAGKSRSRRRRVARPAKRLDRARPLGPNQQRNCGHAHFDAMGQQETCAQQEERFTGRSKRGWFRQVS
jgi:hypothetical protein